jgi:hypothetical protein
MDPTIVGDHVRHREDPRVPAFGEDVDAHPGERPRRRDEVLVDAVHATHHPADTIEVEAGRRRARQDAGPGCGRDQGPDRLRGQLHIRVQVDPGKRVAGLVAEAQRGHLAGNRGFHDPYADPPGDLGRPIGACVGHHDHVELPRLRAGEQPPQVAVENGLLVVRRHDDAHDRLPLADRTPRLAHRTAPLSPPDRIAP